MTKENTCNIDTLPSKSKYSKTGAGRKVTIPDVRQALFEWFIDDRSSLKGRLPIKMFKIQCHLLYDQWLAQQPGNPRGKKDCFLEKLDQKMDERFGVSLRKPNKRFQIKQARVVPALE